MAKYGINYYGSSKYGSLPKLAYSVEPMSILATTFNQVFIAWQSPSGTFSRVRIVRNQAGFPETAEDGIIIFDEFATEGTVSRSYFIDGENNPTDVPLVSGRQVFYRFFIFTSETYWVTAGSIATVLPSNHNIQNTFINFLPKVFTSADQTALSVTDTNSNIYNFVDGLMFTQEEFYTLVDLLKPSHTGLETPYQLIPSERSNVGLLPEPALPIKNQKRLIREALYMYTHKGTKEAIGTYAESLTGFAPTITVSNNMMLNVQDSTFYNGIGNWAATNATLSASTDQAASPGDNVIDVTYSGKVIATNSGSLTLGNDDPITKGIPVLEEVEYTVSCKLKSPASAGNVTIKVTFCDFQGTETLSYTSSSVSANNTWKSASVTATSAIGDSYAKVEITYSAAGTYYFDQVCFQIGDTVAYDEARCANIVLSPTKTNFINNPSFETSTTDSWTSTGSPTLSLDTDVSDEVASGSKSLKVVASGAWSLSSNYITIENGNYYTVSGYLKTSTTTTLTLVGFDNSNSIVGTPETVTLPTSANWARFTHTILVDINEPTIVKYKVKLSGGSGTYYFDCIQFEKSPKATDYFDGNLASQFGAVWESTVNNSSTLLYPNKLSKIPRLAQTLNDWVPENTFWRISTPAGLEYTNLTV